MTSYNLLPYKLEERKAEAEEETNCLELLIEVITGTNCTVLQHDTRSVKEERRSKQNAVL